MFAAVQKDIDYVEKDVAKRRENVRMEHGVDINTKYDISKKKIMESRSLVADWKVRGC